MRKEIVEHLATAELRQFVGKCLSNPARFEAYKANQAGQGAEPGRS